nr:MAG TPA: hypothetical protein [Caudoviricetes sp.]
MYFINYLLFLIIFIIPKNIKISKLFITVIIFSCHCPSCFKD